MDAQALILAAGYATRMYPLTQHQPKSLLPIGSRVVIDWTVTSLCELPEISRVFIVTNAKFAAQFDAWRKQRNYSTPIICVNDGSTDDANRLGSIRDMQLVMEQERVRGPLLVSAGDHIAEWDLTAFLHCARRRDPYASVALYRLPDRRMASKFGMAHVGNDQRVVRCEEKPARTTSDLAVVCLYYFPGQVLPRLAEYLATGQDADAPGHFISWLCQQEPVYGWTAQGRLFDIGSLESYDVARQALEGADA